MDIDKLINRIADHQNEEDLDLLCDLLKKKKIVRFHVLDEGQFKKEAEITATGNGKNFSIPVTNVGGEDYAVMYPSLKNIKQFKPVGYRTFGIKGSEAFGLVASLKNVKGVLVQGQGAWVAIPMSKVKEVCENHA
jgi:hypothetical protein